MEDRKPNKNLLPHAFVILGKGQKPQPRTLSVEKQAVLMEMLVLTDQLLSENHELKNKPKKEKNAFAVKFNEFFLEKAVYSPDGEMITFMTEDWNEFCEKWKESANDQ